MLREMHGKLRAQAEHSRLQLTSTTETNPLHQSVTTSVLALKRETERDQKKNEFILQREIQDMRERLDETSNQLIEFQTKNEVLNVRATNAMRTAEEYREKSRKLQEILTNGISTNDTDMSKLLSKVATLESQLIISRNETERCHVELTNSLSAMETARDRLLQSSESKELVERQCEQLRQNMKDSETKTRMLLTRIDVLNEDCLSSKKEVGSLQAENAHLEQQLMVTQKKLSALQQSDQTNAMTMNTFQEQLNVSKREVEESRTKVSQFEAKLQTAENEVYRAKTEMEEERRTTERMREQLNKLNKTHEMELINIRENYEHDVKKQIELNNELRQKVAEATTEALANAAKGGSDIIQYKEEILKLQRSCNEKDTNYHDIVQLNNEKDIQLKKLKSSNDQLNEQLKNMEETMFIKDKIFREHSKTAEKLTKERDNLSSEIVALQSALRAERDGTAPLPRNSSQTSVNRDQTRQQQEKQQQEKEKQKERNNDVRRSLPTGGTPSSSKVPTSSSTITPSLIQPKPPPGSPPLLDIPLGTPTTVPLAPPPPSTLIPSVASDDRMPASLPSPTHPPVVARLPKGPPPTNNHLYDLESVDDNNGATPSTSNIAPPSVPLPPGPPPGMASSITIAPPSVPLPSGPPPPSTTTSVGGDREGTIFIRPPPNVADF